jgi:hypothetical protein
MSIASGECRPQLTLIKPFVAKNEHGHEYTYSKYSANVKCTICDKPIEQGCWITPVQYIPKYYHMHCVDLK